MVFDPLKRVGFAILLLTLTLAAQQPPSPSLPKFEFVSIRPVPPNAPLIMREVDFTPVLPGGQYIDSRTALLFMITFAYDVKDPSIHLVGLPKWATEQGYAVAAKPAEGFPALPPGENREQVRLMMRSMLADRFHLQLHVENRQAPVFRLEVARGGVKIKEVEPPVPPQKEAPVGAAMSDRRGRMIGNKSTMSGLAGALTVFLKRLVLDETGLKGYYDFDVRWDAPESVVGQPSSVVFGAEGAGLLISNLQSQLGLRLTSASGPVQYWVVDHVEPPTDN